MKAPSGYKRRDGALILVTKPRPNPYSMMEKRIVALEGRIAALEMRLETLSPKKA
jgi:hypothetical protein